ARLRGQPEALRPVRSTPPRSSVSTGIASFVRKERPIIRSCVIDQPIMEAQGIAVCCPFIGQECPPAHARAGNWTSEFVECFRVLAVAAMIFVDKDSYLFPSFDTFVERVTKGSEPANKS